MEYIATGVRWIAESYYCRFDAESEKDAKRTARRIVRGEIDANLHAEPLVYPAVRIRTLTITQDGYHGHGT